MLFRRRNPKPFLQKVLHFLWPANGFKRMFKYLYFRIVRIPDRCHSIGMGLAIGVAVSFTPFIGFHLLLIAAICAIFRANIPAAFLSSLVGNPWTFPIFFYATYSVGAVLTGQPLLGIIDFFDMIWALFEVFGTAVWTFDLQLFIDKVWPLWYPMAVGSIPFVIIFFSLTYFFAMRIINRYHLCKIEQGEKNGVRNRDGCRL